MLSSVVMLPFNHGLRDKGTVPVLPLTFVLWNFHERIIVWLAEGEGPTTLRGHGRGPTQP